MDDDSHLAQRSELFRPTNSIIFDGFSRASVVASWLFHRDTKESHLVLAQGTLIHDEIPRIDVTPSWNVRLGGKSPWTLSQESYVVTARQAYEWFTDLVETGVWASKWAEPFANAVPLANRLNEPTWPTLVLLKDTTAVPLRAAGDGARGNHLLSTATVLDALQAPERTKLYETMLARSGINLAPVPEMVQSAHFVQQCPFIRSLSTRLDTHTDESDRAVLLDVVPRRGGSLNDVTVEVLETRGTGMSILARGSASMPFLRIALDDEVGQISVRLVHRKYGLVRDEGPFAFLRSFRMNVQLMSDRRIALPARKGREAVVRKLPSRSHDTETIVGSRERPASARHVLASIQQRLKKEASAEKKQYWFRGEVAEAETVIHEILSSVCRLAMVVDPYFAAPEVRPWLPFVQRGAIRVLTSSAGLRQRKSTAHDAVSKSIRESSHLTALSKELAAATEERLLGGEVEVKIMHGDKPPVHDRFIVVDDRAWLLGSSLNEFGTRGTTLVVLPSPERIIRELENIWNNEAEGLTSRLQALSAEIGTPP